MELEDSLLRLRADFENYRKRAQREKDELTQHANEKIMAELIGVLDHLGLALRTAEERHAGEAFLEGLKLISGQLLSVLQRFGLVTIEAEGQTFDPRQHEAIAQTTSDTHPEGTVIAQTRKGYWLGRRLLRPAGVIVSSGSGRQPPPATDEQEEPAE